MNIQYVYMFLGIIVPIMNEVHIVKTNGFHADVFFHRIEYPLRSIGDNSC